MKKLLILSLFFILRSNAVELPIGDSSYGVLASNMNLDVLSEGLALPPISESGLVQTRNQGGGFMLIHLDAVSVQFIECAKKSSYPLLEIGTAFGVATIPALSHSSCPIIANDIGVENLLILRKQTKEEDRDRLYLNSQKFPEQLDFPASSLGGVLICRVFHFLRGEEIEEGLKKIFGWLVPGCRVFIVTATPYLGNLKEFVSLYEKRWEEGNQWPGYVEDFGPNARGLSHNLNPFLHVMDERPLRRALEAAGFIIEKIETLDRRKTIPMLALDGREGIGVIAVKPPSNKKRGGGMIESSPLYAPGGGFLCTPAVIGIEEI